LQLLLVETLEDVGAMRKRTSDTRDRDLSDNKALMVELFIWRGFLRREQPNENAQWITGCGMLLLLSVTQPGQNHSLLTPVALRPSFTRSVPLSFQVLLQITTNPDVMSWPLELSKRNFNVSTRFISAFIKPSKS